RRCVSASLDTSHSTRSACAPRASTSLTAGFGSARSATTTRAPSAATPRQYARPMPLAPPVTMTTLSLSRMAPSSPDIITLFAVKRSRGRDRPVLRLIRRRAPDHPQGFPVLIQAFITTQEPPNKPLAVAPGVL